MILFHILDEAEVQFPFDGMVELEDPENQRAAGSSTPTASAATTWTKSRRSASTYRRECFQAGIDYVPLDTSMQFDQALTEYLVEPKRASRLSS